MDNSFKFILLFYLGVISVSIGVYFFANECNKPKLSKYSIYFSITSLICSGLSLILLAFKKY